MTTTTTATGMRKNGHSFVEIAHVLKHKNLESLNHYLDTPTMKDKEKFSKTLFKYTNKTDLDTDSDMSDFEVPKLQLKKKINQNAKLLQQSQSHLKTTRLIRKIK